MAWSTVAATSESNETTLPVEFIGTLTATTMSVPPVPVAGPNGTRMTDTATDAKLVGPRITATGPEGVVAGDWLLARADGSTVLDVRANLRTDDGADIYASYSGIGRNDDDGTFQIRSAPLFETGDERYAWLNDVQCVGIGRAADGRVEYQIYALE